MSHVLTVELSDDAYAAVRKAAEATGATPEAVAADWLSERGVAARQSPADAAAARARFEAHFGSVDLGYPLGLDNEQIDADLAREYADNHEPK